MDMTNIHILENIERSAHIHNDEHLAALAKHLRSLTFNDREAAINKLRLIFAS